MEMKLGTTVITLVEKEIVEFVDRRIRLPKGLVGVVCDDEHLSEGWVLVQFTQKEVLEKGTGVYDYNLDEIRAVGH